MVYADITEILFADIPQIVFAHIPDISFANIPEIVFADIHKNCIRSHCWKYIRKQFADIELMFQ